MCVPCRVVPCIRCSLLFATTNFGPALIHYLLRVQGVRIIRCHLLRCDARVLHWQIIYLMRIDDVFALLHYHVPLAVQRSMNSLILR